MGIVQYNERLHKYQPLIIMEHSVILCFEETEWEKVDLINDSTILVKITKDILGDLEEMLDFAEPKEKGQWQRRMSRPS